MATLYAQGSGNLDAVVWNTAANGSGTNETPTSVDTLVSNTFTITVNADYTFVRVTNTLGGTFTLTNGVTLTVTDATSGVLNNSTLSPVIVFPLNTGQSATIIGHVVAGTNPGAHAINITGAGGALTIIGNVYAGQFSGSSANGHGVNATGSCTLNITGNIVGGMSSNPSYGVLLAGVSIFNLTGNITGSNKNSFSYGMYVSSASTLTINGNITGGLATAYGLCITAAATLNQTGNVTGGGGAEGHGLYNTGALAYNLTGSLTGGAAAAVAVNNTNTSATINITGNIKASRTSSALTSAICPILLTGNLVDFVSNQGTPVAVGATNAGVRMAQNAGPWYHQVANHDCSGTIKLYTANHPDSTSKMPLAAKVRQGQVYGPSDEFTGTCYVPAVGSVSLNTPVGAVGDVTPGVQPVGAAVLSQADVTAAVWDTLVADLDTANSIGARLAQAATVPSTGAQIAALGV